MSQDQKPTVLPLQAGLKVGSRLAGKLGDWLVTGSGSLRRGTSISQEDASPGPSPVVAPGCLAPPSPLPLACGISCSALHLQPAPSLVGRFFSKLLAQPWANLQPVLLAADLSSTRLDVGEPQPRLQFSA